MLAQIICVFWSFHLIQNHRQEGDKQGLLFLRFTKLVKPDSASLILLHGKKNWQQDASRHDEWIILIVISSSSVIII